MRYNLLIISFAFIVSSVINTSEIISKDVKFRFEVIYDENLKNQQEANELFLESGLLNGNISLLELSQQVLKRGFNEDILEKYNDKNTIDVIDDNNNLLKLLDEVRDNAVELKEEIENGIMELDNLENNQKLELEEALEQNYTNIQKLEALKGKMTPESSKVLYEYIGYGLIDLRNVRNEIVTIDKPKTSMMMDSTRTNLYFRLSKGISSSISLIVDDLKESGFLNDDFSYESLDTLKSAIELIENNMDQMTELKELSNKIPNLEGYMNMLEELRDSQLPQQMTNLISQLDQGIESIFKEPNQGTELAEFYEKNINSSSLFHPITEKIGEMSSDMSFFQRKLYILSGQWTLFEDFQTKYTEVIESIPKGKLFENFNKLHLCLEQIDTSIDYEAVKIELDSIYQSITDYIESRKKFIVATDEMMVLSDELQSIWQKLEEKRHAPFEEYKKIIKLIDLNKLKIIENDIIPAFQETLFKANDMLKEIDFSLIWDMVNQMNDKFKETQKFISCWSDLKVSNPEIPSRIHQLLNIQKESLNMDLNFLEGTVEVIDLFKGAYRMNEKFKIWEFKSEENEEIQEKKKTFPLKIDELNGISDGIQVINQIRKIQENFQKIQEYDEIKGALEDTVELQNFQNFIEKLSENFGNLTGIDTKSIQFDGILKFIQNEYKLNGKFELLKIFEEIQNFLKSSDFVSFNGKINKMEMGIQEFKKWNNFMTSDEKMEIFDCYENPCNITITLPMATQNDPIKEFNV